MILTITSSGENDDKEVSYTLVAETATYKTTLGFYAHADTFVDFAHGLLNFPFTSKKDVEYKDGNYYSARNEPILCASLADAAGRIDFTVHTVDEHGNVASFTDTTVEAESLRRLAFLLIGTDFAYATQVVWDSTAAQ